MREKIGRKIMKYFGKKEQKVIDKFLEHLDTVEETVKNLVKFIDAIRNKNREEIRRLYDLVHENESAADEIRRAFEIEMYEGAFLPNFRGDLLGLSEQFDKIANKCERITEYYVLENLTIPEIIIEDLILQMELSLKSFKSAKKAAYSLVNDTTKVEKHISNSCERESIEDEIERKLIKKVYDMDIQLAEKQQLGKFVRAIGDLADKSENCVDRIQLALIKRMA